MSSTLISMILIDMRELSGATDDADPPNTRFSDSTLQGELTLGNCPTRLKMDGDR